MTDDGYRAGCEADMYEFFQEAAEKTGTKAEWIIRAGQDRNLTERTGKGFAHLWDKVASTRVLRTMEVDVRKRPAHEAKDGKRNQARTARTATVTIQAARVELRGPQRPGGRPGSVQVNAILVREQDPLEGEEPLFQDADRYLPCLALYMVLAWRVMYVMMLSRECPDMSCADVCGCIQ